MIKQIHINTSSNQPLITGSQLWKRYITDNRNSGMSFGVLTPPHFSTCPKPAPGFPLENVVFYEFINLKWRVVVRLVDISGIVGHRWWDFLFINSLYSTNWRYLKLHVYKLHTQMYHIKYAAIKYVHSLLVRMFRSIIVSDEQLWKGSLWHP